MEKEEKDSEKINAIELAVRKGKEVVKEEERKKRIK